MYKVIIIDDENKARLNLALLLNKHSDMDIVAQAANYDEALIEVAKHLPDLIFLDIKMPEHSGFDVLDKLVQLNINTFDVVFLTSYDEYAIQAIKYAAFDYLLKPIDNDELDETLIRFRTKKHKHLLLQVNALQNMLNTCKKLKISTNEGFEYIEYAQIVYLEADGNYTNIHTTEGQPYKVCKTLKDMEDELISNSFIRVHKTYLINRLYLKAYKRDEKICLLKSQTQNYTIPVSTRLMKNINF